MSYGRDDVEPFEGDGPHDSVLIESVRPLRDDEAEQLESLCQEAAPGPFVVGDAADGEGVLIATLSDGRQVICRKFGIGHQLPRRAIDATARLFCQARHLLLRLLEDRKEWTAQRERWESEREQLLGQIAELQRTVQPAGPRGQRAPDATSSTSGPIRPR